MNFDGGIAMRKQIIFKYTCNYDYPYSIDLYPQHNMPGGSVVRFANVFTRDIHAITVLDDLHVVTDDDSCFAGKVITP